MRAKLYMLGAIALGASVGFIGGILLGPWGLLISVPLALLIGVVAGMEAIRHGG